MNSLSFEAPFPFRFNPSKHHLKWICKEILLSEVSDDIFKMIKSLNSNNIDIYTGNLDPLKLIDEIKNIIEINIKERSSFRSWLNNREFRLIELSDSSVWVLREGFEDERYIHIHPARTTPYSIRIHGNSLKTALIYKILFKNMPCTLEKINSIRVNYLDLSPVKDLHACLRIHSGLEMIKKTLSKDFLE